MFVPPELATRMVSPIVPSRFAGQAARPHGRDPTGIGAWNEESPRSKTSSSFFSILLRYSLLVGLWNNASAMTPPKGRLRVRPATTVTVSPRCVTLSLSSAYARVPLSLRANPKTCTCFGNVVMLRPSLNVCRAELTLPDTWNESAEKNVLGSLGRLRTSYPSQRMPPRSCALTCIVSVTSMRGVMPKSTTGMLLPDAELETTTFTGTPSTRRLSESMRNGVSVSVPVVAPTRLRAVSTPTESCSGELNSTESVTGDENTPLAMKPSAFTRLGLLPLSDTAIVKPTTAVSVDFGFVMIATEGD